MNDSTRPHSTWQESRFRAAMEASALRPQWRAVLRCLVDHTDGHGHVAGVSSLALADAAGIPQGRAVEIVHSLARHGWLTVHSGRRLGRGNTYTLTPGGGAR